MVYVPGRKAIGAKLPSEGLRLNASKSESRPDLQRYYVSALLNGSVNFHAVGRVTSVLRDVSMVWWMPE